MVVPTDEIPTFHKVRSKVIEYGESESGNKLSKMGIKFCETIETFFYIIRKVSINQRDKNVTPVLGTIRKQNNQIFCFSCS